MYLFVREAYELYANYHWCRNETITEIENGTSVEYTRYNGTNKANITLLMLNESGHIPFLNAFEVSEDAARTRTNNAKYDVPERPLKRPSQSAAAHSRLAVT